MHPSLPLAERHASSTAPRHKGGGIVVGSRVPIDRLKLAEKRGPLKNHMVIDQAA